MRVSSRTILHCAVLLLTFAAFTFAEEPAKKADDENKNQSEQQVEQKSDEKSEKQEDSKQAPADKQAAKKAKEKVEKAKKGNDEPIVFTNGDLEALFGKAEPSAPPQPPASGVVARPGGSTSRATQSEKTEARIQAIQAEIKRLNEMNRSLKNPYLARVKTTDEEKKAFENKGADERIRINNERIAALREELAKLQRASSAAPAKPKR